MKKPRFHKDESDPRQTAGRTKPAALAVGLCLLTACVAFGFRYSRQTPLVNLTLPLPPHDAPNGAQSSLTDLAVFGWQEFVALNWPSVDTVATGLRGTPDTTKAFTDTTAANPLLTVWQTYRHKNEQFPANKMTDPNFDSKLPTYNYFSPVKPAPGARTNLWNNLDESSEITLCTMFGQVTGPEPYPDTQRVLYEAKMNRNTYDYGNAKTSVGALTDPTNNFAALTSRRSMTIGTGNTNNLPIYGGVCSSPDADKIVMLPCGDLSVTGQLGEGAIETKAAWRRLTRAEAASGRFYTATVLYYATDPNNPNGFIAMNAVYGLVALHIIHKTQAFPAFVFATFEQVDQFKGSNTANLAFHNTGTQETDTPVARAFPIPSEVEAVNADVLAQLRPTKCVWQYYKMVGVQAVPFTGTVAVGPGPGYTPIYPPQVTYSGPIPPSAPKDAIDSVFFLANIMVETNQPLANFFGGLRPLTGPDGNSYATPIGTDGPKINVYLAGNSYQMGGCQGCHGSQGQHVGGDMSVLLGAAPRNAKNPEAYNAGDAAVVGSKLLRGLTYGTP